VIRGDELCCVASEQAVPVRSAVIGAVKADEDETQSRTPMGRRHAVREGSTTTACGRPLAGLHTFPNLAWADFSLASRTCPACLVAVESARVT
jgi:hypothetical protein